MIEDTTQERTNHRVDWRTLKDAELQARGQEAIAMMRQIEQQLGIVFKAVIVVSPDGRMAQAQIVIDLK
jgi:hypothetical protein